MVAKAGLRIIGLSAIGLGGVAFTKPEWLGIKKEITWEPLSKDGTTDSSYQGKFGGKHKNYLVGMKETNKDWWEESYKRLKEGNVGSGAFQLTTKVNNWFSNGTSSTDPKALNQVCDDAYKADSASIKADATESGKFNEEHVWKYCSGLGEKPKTIAEVDTANQQYKDQVSGQNPIGKDTTNRSKLISTTGNDKFWEIRDKEFKNKDNYGPIEDGASDAFFKVSEGTTIRDLCEKAYKSKASNNGGTATEPKKDKVLKYCSLDKSSQ